MSHMIWPIYVFLPQKLPVSIWFRQTYGFVKLQPTHPWKRVGEHLFFTWHSVVIKIFVYLFEILAVFLNVLRCLHPIRNSNYDVKRWEWIFVTPSKFRVEIPFIWISHIHFDDLKLWELIQINWIIVWERSRQSNLKIVSKIIIQ